MHPQECLQKLIDRIRNDEKVTKHTVLKSKKWTKSSYENLSDLIGEYLRSKLNEKDRITMGTTLSSKTLSNLVMGKYTLTYPIDPRTINTLSKLAVFVGFRNWDDWVLVLEKDHKKALENGSPSIQILHQLKEAIQHEYLAYCNLPEINPEPLFSCFLENSPGFLRIMDNLKEHQRKGLTLSNLYNPSSYEILGTEIIYLKEQEARIDTEEYWLLCWWDASQKRYVRRIKHIGKHTYLLSFSEEKWKIRNKVSVMDLNGEENVLPQKNKVTMSREVLLTPGISSPKPG